MLRTQAATRDEWFRLQPDLFANEQIGGRNKHQVAHDLLTRPAQRQFGSQRPIVWVLRLDKPHLVAECLKTRVEKLLGRWGQ